MTNSTHSPRGLIGNVLAPACAAWLRTQVTQVDDLDVQIAAQNRQILTGTIPEVAVMARGTVYRGISLAKIQILAQNIAVNLGQVVRGKPLQLLHPIEVEAEATISEADLLASLTAPLLAGGIQELMAGILGAQADQAQIQWQRVYLQPDRLLLEGEIATGGAEVAPLQITTNITVHQGHILILSPLEITCPLWIGQVLPTEYAIDLGTGVQLRQLTLTAGNLLCQGQILVRP